MKTNGVRDSGRIFWQRGFARVLVALAWAGVASCIACASAPPPLLTLCGLDEDSVPPGAPLSEGVSVVFHPDASDGLIEATATAFGLWGVRVVSLARAESVYEPHDGRSVYVTICEPRIAVLPDALAVAFTTDDRPVGVAVVPTGAEGAGCAESLLPVMAHEVGHLVGLPHEADGVMTPRVRCELSDGEIAEIVRGRAR